MAAMKKRPRWLCDRGAELVEFAIVTPVLLLLMGGIVDFALLFHSFQVSQNAAREGARLAVLPGYSINGFASPLSRVDAYMAAGGVSGSFTRTAEFSPIDLGNGLFANGARVTVNYTHTFMIIGPLVGLINGTFTSSVTFSTTSAMRAELQGS